VRKRITSRIVLNVTFAAALLLAASELRGAPQAPETKPEAAPPGTPNASAEPPKTEPEAPKPPEPAAAETPPAAAEDAPASLGDLTREGFEIIATDFIPAEAVTRQSGKVSSDAVVVLQKQNATAVCFYTLKAYVGKKLTAIPACTVHR
jgi:hypothetical protein